MSAPMSKSERLHLCKKARNGSSDMQLGLAAMLRDGDDGFPQDLQEAFYWGKKATETDPNSGNAWYFLALMYAGGRGVDRNMDMALKCFKLATDRKCWTAAVSLAQMYQGGTGVPLDYAEAARLYLLAIDKLEGEDDWLSRATAMLNVGGMYENGNHFEPDMEKAFYWFERGAKAGSLGAMYNTGRCLCMGKGVERDFDKAIEWWQKGAKKGDSDCITGLASVQHLVSSSSTGDDMVKLYQIAAEQGNPVAQMNLGMLYRTGSQVPKDEEMAVKWFNLAALQGYEPAAMFADGSKSERMECLPIDKHCCRCGKSEKLGAELMRCARCRGVRYCSVECQKAAWPAHKKVCKKKK